jgi:hypothetical protein
MQPDREYEPTEQPILNLPLEEEYKNWKRTLRTDYCEGKRIHEIRMEPAFRAENVVCPFFHKSTGRCRMVESAQKTGHWVVGRCVRHIMFGVYRMVTDRLEGADGFELNEREFMERFMASVTKAPKERDENNSSVETGGTQKRPTRSSAPRSHRNILSWAEWWYVALKRAASEGRSRRICKNCRHFSDQPRKFCSEMGRPVNKYAAACESFAYPSWGLSTIDPEKRDAHVKKVLVQGFSTGSAASTVKYWQDRLNKWAMRRGLAPKDREIRLRLWGLMDAFLNRKGDQDAAFQTVMSEFKVGRETVKNDWNKLKKMLRGWGYPNDPDEWT